jgi:dTMP kinase
MHTGFFITIEGIDGIGKSTQLALLMDYLKAKYHESRGVHLTKEPGDANTGSAVGAGVRHILFKEPGTAKLASGVADLLFLADHIQNVHEIRNTLQDGQIVVSDRYADSQFAYASSATKKAPAWANKLFVEHYGVIPDLTLLFVARGPVRGKFQAGHTNIDSLEDIGWALRRANARRGAEAGKQDGKAWNDVEEQRKIQDSYLAALRGQSRTQLIHVWEDDSPEDTHDRVVMAVELAMSNHGLGAQPNLPLVDAVAA